LIFAFRFFALTFLQNRNFKTINQKMSASAALSGQVVSLHLHPSTPGAPLQSVEVVELIEGKGILNDARYFGRLDRDSGQPSRRQVSLIEREQIADHALALGMPSIPAGSVRSNIETSGLNLIALLGQEIEIGQAVLFLYSQRDPCEKMDAVCRGLRERMMNRRQGVLAEVRRSGQVRIGDAIRLHEATVKEDTAKA
jgi:MOSC domain-containing protein YiiM